MMTGPSLVHRSARLAGVKRSDSDPIPRLPDAGPNELFLSRPHLHITHPAERRRRGVYSGFPLPISSSFPSSWSPSSVPVCVCCLTLIVHLVLSSISSASIVVSRYLLQHLPLPIISRHRLPKTLLPRYFDL